jgi:large repetitive protein
MHCAAKMATFRRAARRALHHFLALVIAVSTLSAISVVSAPSANAVTVGSAPCIADVGNSNATSQRVGNDCVITFTSSNTWTVPAGVTTANVLVVGGGGGGSGRHAGGGGAGGFIETTTSNLSGEYTIVVGAGGSGSSQLASNSSTPTTRSQKGGNSSVSGNNISITSVGGGAGAGRGQPVSAADRDGGSGGGSDCGLEGCPTGTGTAGQGFNGGQGVGGEGKNWSGGGGGGAGGAGGAADSAIGGNGGAGKSSSISGASVTYAGGGGGATYLGTRGSGGLGGGGNGGNGAAGSNATGYGSGGGGGGHDTSVWAYPGGNGSSGIVVVRYTVSSPGAPNIGTATAGNASASVPFTAPASNGGSAITTYTATSSPGGITGTLSQAGSGTISVTGLSNGTAYTFTVTATNAVGTSVASGVSNAVTPRTVSGAPNIGTATAGNASASVPFTAPASNGGSAITTYTATSSPGGITGTLSQAGSGTISVTGLSNGTAYTFTVTATNEAGTSSASSASNSVTPLAPCSLSNTDTTSAPGYTIIRFTEPGSCNWSVPAGVTAADVLVVGGGGGGGIGTLSAYEAGGGGAGGFIQNLALSLASSSYLIKVGAGGTPNNDGDSSSFGTTTASGGGGGGTNAQAGRNGASGGGGVHPSTSGGTGIAGQGFAGGAGRSSNGNGGGGAAEIGGTDGVGHGGDGLVSSITGLTYAGGGAGAGGSGVAGEGGGGARATSGNAAFNSASNGAANTGGGGGGGFSPNSFANAGSGGSGVVVVKYLSTYTVTYSFDGADAGNTTSSATFNPGGTAITLPTPTKTGFSFSGWFTASSGGSLVGLGGATYSPAGTTPAITLHARWGAPSGTVSVPSAPDSVTATGSSGGIQVTWATPLIIPVGQSISNYQVEYSTTGAANSWTVASSAILSDARSYTITGLTNSSAYYVRIAALFSGGRGAYGYPWQKIYGTVTPTRNGSNITYQAGFGTTVGDAFSLYSSFTRVRYLMRATYGGNNNYADIDFSKGLQNASGSNSLGYTLDTTSNIRIPSLGSTERFIVQGDVYDLTVLAPSTVSVQNGYGFNGRVEIWPWDYGTTAASLLTSNLRSSGSIYDDADSTPATGSYGSFQLHNISPGNLQTILAWNNHGGTPDIGFGNFTGNVHTDWTFCARDGFCSGVNNSRTNFSLEIFVNAPITASSAPGSPTGVTATAGNAQASVSWSAPSSNGGATISGYTVTSSPSVTAPAGCTNTANLSCTFTGLTNGTAYTFTVVAINSVGTSSASSASTAVTPATTPGAPTSVTATVANAQSSISWTAPSSTGGSVITGYTVTSSPSVTAPAGCTATLSTSCTFTGLTNGTAYTFTVVATNSIGNSSSSTASSSVTPRTTPGAPTGVTATAGNVQVSLSWTAPTSTGGSAITGYTVTSSPSVSAPAGCTNTLNTSCTFTGLTNGTSYTFTVVAINAAGSSSASSASSAVIPATTSGTPTGASATVGFKQSVVSWSAPSSNGGSAITGYTVTSTPSVTAPAGCVNTANLSCTFTGLTAGTAYTFTVVAINAVGNSSSSTASSSATPFGDCVVTPTSSGGYKTYVFTTIGLCAWTVPSGASRIEAVAVGGGGGAAFGSLGGGGGAGRVIVADAPLTVSPGDVVIIKVGKGGAGGWNATQTSWTFGSNGDPSSLTVGSTEYSATGGGGGGGGASAVAGAAGGSGGGGAGTSSVKAGGAKDSSTITGFTTYGSNGGTGIGASNGGGGGGASEAGNTDGNSQGGDGISIWGTELAGGGGGWQSGVGGTGGGGSGLTGTATAAAAGTQGTDGLGGGGGGGQKGGTGRVMIRFIEQITITPTVSPTSINYGSSTSIAASYSQSLTYTLTTNPTCEIYSDALRANKVSTNGAISGAAASALAAGTYYVNCSGAVATEGPSISYASDATFTIASITLTTVTTPTLAATTNTAASLTATWTSVSNATSYTVKVYPGAGGSALATITSATSPFVINSSNYSGILGGTSYKVTVTAIGSGGYVSSSESTQSSAVTTLGAPTITSMSSSSGAVVGGATTITLGGTNLSTTSGVTIGSVTATVVSATNTAVVLSIPSATITGNKNLVLTTPVSAVTVSDSYVDCGTSGNFFLFNNAVVGTNYCVGTVEVPTGITNIAQCAFATAIGGNCGATKGNSISTVSLPTSLRTISAFGFLGSNMTSINLPEGLTTIGNSAFYMGGMYTLHIPSTVTSVNTAFYKTNARAITFAAGSAITSMTDVFRGMPNIFSIAIPDSVTTIVGTLTFASSFATITMRGVTTLPAGSLPTTLTCIVTSSGNTAVNGYSFTSFATAPSIVTSISSCPQPTITSLSVVSGTTSGATSTVISGTNLINTTGVTVGGNAATITARTTTSVTISTPAGSAGAANVVVTTEAGNVTRSNGFTYLGASITITYDSQSGSSVSSGSSSVGGTITSAPTAPTRSNYTFSGWSATSDGAVVTFPYTHGQTANFSLFAIWVGNSLTLTYDSQSGSTVTAVTTNVGASVSAAPAAPTRANFTFAGWSETIGGTAITFPYTHAKTANFTLYAKWTSNSYTVTYVYNSATGGNSTATDSFTTGGTQITLPTPTRTGYTFAGWFAESNFVTSVGAGGASYGPTGTSLTPSVYAKWTALNYTVTYATTDSTGGASPSDSTNYNIGNNVVIKGNTGSLARAGYTFTGWTAASDGSGTVLTSGTTFTVSSSNMTLYPKWSANTYTITYNKNGASGSPTASTASYTSGSTAVTLTTVGDMVKTGFNFGGWSTSPTGTAHSGTYTTTSDVTLFAVWNLKSIAITFSKGIADGVTVNNFPTNTNLSYGSTLTLAGNLTSTVVISGAAYAFAGWSLSGNIYRGGDTYLVGETSPTFTAEWVKVFAVRYALNGGTSAAGSSEVDAECTFVDGSDLRCTENQVITVNAAPTRAGFTFAGWVNQGNEARTAAATTTITTTNYLFYANWTPVDYAISYDTASGSTAPASFTKRIGETFTVATAPTRTGYRFNGWSDGTLNLGAGATYIVSSSPVTLTAQWIANVYTVIYDWNGGSGSGTSNDSFTVGTSAITLPVVGNHVKDGFTFSGWSESTSGSLLSGGYTPTADTTLYAIWGSGSYTTTYSANGGTVATSSEAVQNGTSLTLPTPTRANFVFEGWYTASTGGTKIGNAGASHQPTQSRTLHAQWTQSSLYGISPSVLSRVGVLTASDSGSTTTTHSNANSSVTVLVPAAALPAGTTINIDRVGDLSRAQSVIAGNNSYIISVVVSWITPAGTVPNTNAGKAISVTITNSTIKAGASVYGIVAGNVTFLANATENGTVTVALTSDPEVVVIATKPNAPTSVAATSSGNRQSVVSWTAPSTDGGSSITGYTATSNTGASCTTVSTSCAVTGLLDGTAYTFTVVATNSVGSSDASSSASATTASVYSVTFNSNDGSSVSNGSFLTGSTVSEPTAPTKTGYTFAGWASVNGGGAETFPFTPGVNSNITMYARWVALDNAVTFDSKSGSTVTSTVFPSGGSVDEPTAPTRAGYTFAGWSATDGGSAVTFPYSPGVTTAITLFAKWSAIDNAVTFDSKGGSSVTSTVFATGGTVAQPTAPTKTGFTFAGWSATDGGAAVTFPYAPGVVTDITLYARWTEVSQPVSGGGGGSTAPTPSVPSTPVPTEPAVPSTPVKSNVTVVAPVTVIGDQDAKVIAVDIAIPTPGSNTKPPAIKIDKASEKFIAEVKVVEGKLVLTPETGFSGKKTVTVTITENGTDRIVQIPLTVLPEAVTKPVLTPTASNRSLIRWTESPNADGYTVFLNGKRVCTTTALSCSVKTILGPDANIEIVSNGGDRTVSQRVDAEFRQNVPVPITRLVSATITKAALTKVDTKALDQVVALIKNQGFGTVVISEITTTSKTKALAAARIESIKKYISSKIGTEEVEFEITPVKSRTYFNNISVKG